MQNNDISDICEPIRSFLLKESAQKLIKQQKEYFQFIYPEPSRFSSVVAHPDLDGEVLGLSSSRHTKDFKMVLTAHQSSACACHKGGMPWP